MSIRYIPKFRYDSQSIKYLGVKAIGRGPITMTQFNVLAKQPMQEVRSIMTPHDERGKEVAGKTCIAGQVVFDFIALSPEATEKLLDTPPWNVTLHAYNPVEDAAYVAKVLGIQLVSVVPENVGLRCDYAAAAIVNWKKA